MIPDMKTRYVVLASLACCVGLFEVQSAFPQAKPPEKPAQGATAQIPFVGCASDGQAGPLQAPAGRSKLVAIPAEVAQRLAYYKAEYGAGVLAPRGWHCFSTYGSNGSNLFVTPDPIDPKAPFSDSWKGFSGQAIQISDVVGGTSGRFEVAQIIARVFPEYKAFAENVIAEGIEPASSFPFGPYPTDKLIYRSKSVVEYETPANTQGLGTVSKLEANGSAIDGVAILSGADTDLVLLSARLSEKDHDLIATIVAQVEKESADSKAQ
jgi:hypothetical protein